MGSRSTSNTYDYIIVGGGIAGLVLASRLSRLLPPADTKRVLVLEAGVDPATVNSEYILSAQASLLARESQHSYQLTVAPNQNLGGRSAIVPVGKGLGGSAAINGGVWTRGPKSDFDWWARIVGDEAWSYNALLPFMKRVESMAVRDENGVVRDDSQHGYDGPLKIVPVRSLWPGRKYPLRDTVQKMWEEASVKYLIDGNGGDQNGLTEFAEVWVDGIRQLPGTILDLTKVEIRTESVVQRVTFEGGGGQPLANGVDLASGEHFVARKEVIVSAGAYHTPQVLKLSGIGDRAELEKHGIKTILENPEVGKNLRDHLAMDITWKLKHPERGLAIGSPKFTDPTYFRGSPLDFIVFDKLDNLEKLGSLAESQEDRDLLLRPDASHVEIVTVYAARGNRHTGWDAALHGSYISTVAVALTTTSRGTITLQSARIQDPPVSDVNFFDTEVDRHISREALRKAASVHLETRAGKSFVSHEVPPEGCVPVIDATDEELDQRIADLGYSLDHPMGSCSMGKVVDSHCRVLGVRGLRVVDASIFPVPISCHPQSAVYATAERVAEWVARGE
jgi:choline dehydrogenase-like flavoprotein